MAKKALASIFLFILTYFFLVIFAIALTITLGYIGYLLIQFYSIWFTWILGLVLLGIGLIVLIFVFKFIFTRVPKSEKLLIEIKAADEPALFALIEEVANEVGTSLPKSVYLSPEVNAGVFYDSLFLSMFLPVRMNLQIGMGVLNTHSKEELRAVIAHEFGHFSQRSMRLGSYVYSANTILHNMLYNNDKFERTLDAWGDIMSYFKLAVVLATVVIKGIQSVLKQVYEVLNVNYFALSREMEYHADAVATGVAGSQMVVLSLLRLELAETSLNVVYNYHESKIGQGLKPLNLYPQQYFAMNHFAMLRKVEIRNGLPKMDVDNVWKSRGTKVVLKDPWATHPDIEDRIRRVNAFDIPAKEESGAIAVNLLINKEVLQEQLTAKVFEHHFIYAKAPDLTTYQQFESDFLNQYGYAFFDERYYGYYQDRLPYYNFDASLLDSPFESDLTYDELFNDEGLIENQECSILEEDLLLLEKINVEPGNIKSFGYDGQQYQIEGAEHLIGVLRESMEILKEKIEQRDRLIIDYFKRYAMQCNQLENWKRNLLLFKEIAESTLSYQLVYMDLIDASNFMTVQTPFEVIEEKMISFMERENTFKEVLAVMLGNPFYIEELTPEQTKAFEKFLSEDWIYYEHNKYIEEDLNRLFAIIPVFRELYYNICLNHKQKFLSYQSSLFPENMVFLSA